MKIELLMYLIIFVNSILRIRKDETHYRSPQKFLDFRIKFLNSNTESFRVVAMYLSLLYKQVIFF